MIFFSRFFFCLNEVEWVLLFIIKKLIRLYILIWVSRDWLFRELVGDEINFYGSRILFV